MQIDFDHAYEYCKQIAIKHYENFPVGSLLIPRDKRKYIYSIYAFARYADDIADSDILSSGEKIERLNELERELTKADEKDLVTLTPATENIFIALSNTIDILRIPVKELKDLLTAFRQDSVKQSYYEFSELIDYSCNSANPIGHLVLYVFGYDREADKKCFTFSDKICTALQLANFWQDVSEDIMMDRIYIPKKLMKENNYSVEMLLAGNENNDFRNIIRVLVNRTKVLFEEGKEITGYVKGRLRLELKATIAGGMEILNKIEKINYNVLGQRVRINNFDKIILLGKIIWK